MARDSAKRINTLLEINGGSKYLEIGVASGLTFERVNAMNKVAVDPSFRFDTQEKTESGKTYIECTSDQYFSEYGGSNFDLIFLDGLHTFEQTLRDFINATSVLSAGGLILIDDVFPEDYAGSLKTMKEMRSYRIATNDESPMHWWGDVYKLIPFLHDFYPNVDYRTSLQGKKQTVVALRRAEEVRRPHFRDIREIASLSFSELVNIPHLWKFCDDNDLFDFAVRMKTER